jgi:hypothetical protein
MAGFASTATGRSRAAGVIASGCPRRSRRRRSPMRSKAPLRGMGSMASFRDDQPLGATSSEQLRRGKCFERHCRRQQAACPITLRRKAELSRPLGTLPRVEPRSPAATSAARAASAAISSQRSISTPCPTEDEPHGAAMLPTESNTMNARSPRPQQAAPSL